MNLCNLCKHDYCELHQAITDILSEGISEDNIERAVMLREIIKQREDSMRKKRQELDSQLYKNIKLLSNMQLTENLKK